MRVSSTEITEKIVTKKLKKHIKKNYFLKARHGYENLAMPPADSSG